MSEFIEQIKPEKDGSVSQDKIDRLLSCKPDKIEIEYPKCKACGKEFYYFFGRRLPEKYDKLCDSCAKEQIQQVSDEKELLSLYESLKEHCSSYLTSEQCHIAYQLMIEKKKAQEHKEYVEEIEKLASKASYILTPEAKEFYALFLERIEKSISENSYKRDPRNIVFNI